MQINQQPPDDPACPSDFLLNEEKKDEEEEVEPHLLLLELAHRMLARQWKLVATTKIQESQDSLLLFRHDARILPGLGGSHHHHHRQQHQQQHGGLVGVAVRQQTGLLGVAAGPRVELLNAEADLAAAVCQELQLGPPTRGRAEEDRYVMEAKQRDEETLYSRVMFALGKQSLTLHSAIQLADLDLFVFRPSNLVASQGLTLVLARGNRIVLRGGGGDPEVEVINRVLAARWPYPVCLNRRLGEEDILANQETEDEKTEVEPSSSSANNAEVEDREVAESFNKSWEWKVRRYPWRVSYGVRLLDRTVQAAGRFLALPPPQHQDLESAKSILIFSIKEFSELGWKFCGGVARPTATYLHFLK